MPDQDALQDLVGRKHAATGSEYSAGFVTDIEADTLPLIIQEMLLATQSERQGRVIDFDQSGSMEEKKKEGYF